MRKIILLLMLITTVAVLAQSTANYSFSTVTTGSLTLDKDGNSVDMSTGTTQLYGANLDVFIATVQNLGFTFIFMGVPYNQFSVNPDGGLRFGSTAIDVHVPLISSSIPYISCINIDNKTGSTGKVHYKIQSGTGGQVLIIEWKNILINWSAIGSTLSTFQLRLYQADGVIEIVYGQMWNSSTSAQNGVVWFGSSNTAGTVGQINTITGTPTYNSSATSLTYTSFTASSAMTNLNSTSDGNRRVFRFTPISAPAEPTSLIFSSIRVSAMTLSWSDNATNETGYVVYRSTDGTNYSLVTTTPLAANTTSYTATGLNASTLYYWRVFAVNEGRLSNALSGSQSTNAPSMSGTKTIGATGDYASLGAAISDAILQGLSGATIFEFQSDYAGSETYPITISQIVGASSTNTLTIRPASGVTGISLSGSLASALIDLDGADYIIFDGRPGGSGTNKEITISNASTLGVTFRFINDATYNIIRYCVVRGVNTVATNGVIFFSTSTSGSTGNDNNLIEYSDIRDGSTTPRNSIYSSGTTTSTTLFNSNNTVKNCNIYNFFVSTGTSSGILLESGNTDWTISDNHFYQTASRTLTSTGGLEGISIAVTAGNNFVVSGNFIGGSEPNAGGGAWTQTGSFSHTFIGIRFSVGTTTASSCQGNTIKNISITTNTTSTINAGISVPTGLVNVGNVTGNTVGDMTTTGSITFTNAGSAAAFSGLLFGSGTPASYNIQNNNIGGITIGGTGTTTFRGIWFATGSPPGTLNPIVNNNIIGGDVANSISNSTNAPSHGIHFHSTSTLWNPTVSGNIVRNINASSTGNAVLCYGIYFQNGGTHTVTSNTIRNLSCASTNSTVQLIGIMISNTSSNGNTISQNVIHTLKQTNSGSGTTHHAYGMYLNVGTTTASNVSRNFIHSLTLATTGTAITTQIRGIELFAGAFNVTNNMIRVGIDEAGSSVTGNYFIQGINKSSSGNVKIFHNSVYVGGSGVGTGSQPTHAFRRATAGVDTIYNNIFVNARSNGSGSGKHYGIVINNTTTITINHNLYHVTGTGGVFGSADGGSTDRSNLIAWQLATGFDFNSADGNFNYANPTGNAISVNLHVQNPTPAERHGIMIAAVTDDFDGSTRSGLTPVDIGADAGDFTTNDIFSPILNYSILTNTGRITNRTLVSVSIKDVTGVPTSGSLQPRIWYRRSAPSATSWASTQGSLSSGSGTDGVWSFTIDYSLLSLTPAVGETYQYYVVVQDEAPTPNIFTNPFGGIHSNVNTQTSAPSSPNSYNILTGFSGTYNVPGDYATLTGTGGLFAAINAGAVTGNITVKITNNISETGANSLEEWFDDEGLWTLTIEPANATTKTISGSYSGGLIRFDGADRVTIDGRYLGSGKYLKFVNSSTSTSANVLTFLGDAQNNTLNSLIIESSGNSVILFSTGMNNYNLIENCEIKNGSSKPTYGIYFNATTNSNNICRNNKIYDFSDFGIFLLNANAVTVEANEIYQTTASSASTVYGISIHNTSTDLSKISRNKIYNLNGSSTATIGGIFYNGAPGIYTNVTMENNVIALSPSTTGTVCGIDYFGFATNSVNILFNSVFIGGTLTTGANNSYGIRKRNVVTNLNILNNALHNARTNSGGSGSHYAIEVSDTRVLGSMTLNYNIFYSSGTGGVLGYWGTANQTTLSAWRTASGQDANSLSGDPTFTSSTNLLPDASNFNSWNVNNKGVQISSVTNDFNGNTRPSTATAGVPDIGAYEFTPSGTPPAATASGSPTAGGTTLYSQAGLQLGSIEWNTNGTVPSSLTFKYYSGELAPSVGSKPKIFGYWDLAATGGSGYTYNLTLKYDEASLNGINENNLIIAKSDDGGTTWVPYTVVGTDPGQIQRNTTANTITVYGLTSFSMFTLGDEGDPLPVELSAFNATVKKRNVYLNWETKSEIGTLKFEVERRSEKETVKSWTKVGEVNASGNSNSVKTYQFVDRKLNSGEYEYRLKMIDIDGSFSYSDVVSVNIDKPRVYDASRNYPNPFNPVTKIDYQLPVDSKVRIELYDITGQLLKVLMDELQSAGYYTYEIDFGRLGLSSGVYIYRVYADNGLGERFSKVQKVLMLK